MTVRLRCAVVKSHRSRPRWGERCRVPARRGQLTCDMHFEDEARLRAVVEQLRELVESWAEPRQRARP